MKLDLSALHDALAALAKSLKYLHSDLAKDVELRAQFRAASILGFKITYDVAYKMLKLQLEEISGAPVESRQRRLGNYQCVVQKYHSTRWYTN